MVFDSYTSRSFLALRRIGFHGLLLAMPTLLTLAFLTQGFKLDGLASLLVCVVFLAYFLVVLASLVSVMNRPLQTLSNVISALREGDYSFRARGEKGQDALGELSIEINSLADLLQKQRVRSLEATALLASILEVMHAPLFAFNREGRLQLINNAGVRLLGRARASCLGAPACELGIDVLLDATDQTIHSFAGASTRWLLRKASFRQDGAPHTLLLLDDVSIPLQAEEQIAWKRLIRVLGHELSNSLAPIKSIAGSLRMRLDDMETEAEVQSSFQRGLNVIESRADALHRFVQSYRRLAQLPPPRLEPVEIAPLVQRIVDLEQRYPVHLEPMAAATLLLDSDQIEQLLINLLANAVDASQSNEENTAQTPVRVFCRVDKKSVVISMEDSGLGIVNADNLFVPFYTTKPTGSGVGLALAQQIAHAHGGQVWLVNRADASGACASVQLPRSM